MSLREAKKDQLAAEKNKFWLTKHHINKCWKGSEKDAGANYNFFG